MVTNYFNVNDIKYMYLHDYNNHILVCIYKIMSCDFCDEEDTDFTKCQTCFSGVCYGCRTRCSKCMDTICPDCDVDEDGICNYCLETTENEEDDDENDEEDDDENDEEDDEE